MKTSDEELKNIFVDYAPEPFVLYLMKLFSSKNVVLKIKTPRKTKFGDFKPLNKNGQYQITINKDLNAYAFLITILHEFAHLLIHEKHQQSVSPHGKEWKDKFRELLEPIMDKKNLPQEIYNALLSTKNKVTSSSCLDYDLYKEVSKYDHQKDYCFLEKIQIGTKFKLNGRTFVKGEIKRKRFLCVESKTKRKYMVQSLAKVKPI